MDFCEGEKNITVIIMAKAEAITAAIFFIVLQ
jgi:hypothetical protein